MVICEREKFWKEKKYKTVASGQGWKIERPAADAPDLNQLLAKALRKKRYKWE